MNKFINDNDGNNRINWSQPVLSPLLLPETASDNAKLDMESQGGVLYS